VTDEIINKCCFTYHEVHDVPRHELDELRAEHDAGNTEEIDGARHEVLRHLSLKGVAEEALHVTVGVALDLGADLDYRHLDGGHSESHAGDLALKGRDHGDDGLGGTGGKRDDVGGGIVATLPVLRIGNTKSSFLSCGHSYQ
jgi:hypothetical protein